MGFEWSFSVRIWVQQGVRMRDGVGVGVFLTARNDDGRHYGADKIVHIVDSDSGTFRHPVGDANVYLAWRASMTDEQWIDEWR